jgi:hypothetical protein
MLMSGKRQRVTGHRSSQSSFKPVPTCSCQFSSVSSGLCPCLLTSAAAHSPLESLPLAMSWPSSTTQPPVLPALLRLLRLELELRTVRDQVHERTRQALFMRHQVHVQGRGIRNLSRLQRSESQLHSARSMLDFLKATRWGLLELFFAHYPVSERRAAADWLLRDDDDASSIG